MDCVDVGTTGMGIALGGGLGRPSTRSFGAPTKYKYLFSSILSCYSSERHGMV